MLFRDFRRTLFPVNVLFVKKKAISFVLLSTFRNFVPKL